MQTRLRQGHSSTPAVGVAARKASGGTRPVPILTAADRIALRAVTNRVLEGEDPLDRSAEAYRDFISGPISAAFEGIQGPTTFADLNHSHVLEADITSFYEYIDHSVLQRELWIRIDDVELIDPLLQILDDVQGRGFGVPQLVDPSDRLSELYIEIVSRRMTQAGFDVWRFNDDFRIACKDYATALRAIETLQEAAREVGLVLNDAKTRTPTIISYIAHNAGMEVSERSQEVDPDDVELIVQDYAEIDDADEVEWARAVLGRVSSSDDPDRIDLKQLRRDEARDLRRALGALGRSGDPSALEHVESLVVFEPSLTPAVCRYLLAIAVAEAGDVVPVLDGLISHALSEWQASWICHVCRSHGVDGQSFRTWAEGLIGRGRGRLLAADSTLYLASIGHDPGLVDLDNALRIEPEPFAPWYLLAMKHLHGGSADGQKRLQALADSDPYYKLILA